MEERQVFNLSVFRFLPLFTVPIIPITTSLFSGSALNLLKIHVTGKGNTILIFVHPFVHLIANKHLLSIYYVPS